MKSAALPWLRIQVVMDGETYSYGLDPKGNLTMSFRAKRRDLINKSEIADICKVEQEVNTISQQEKMKNNEELLNHIFFQNNLVQLPVPEIKYEPEVKLELIIEPEPLNEFCQLNNNFEKVTTLLKPISYV